VRRDSGTFGATGDVFFDLERFLNCAFIYGNGSPFKSATEPGLRTLRKPSRNTEREAMTYPV
jgi:hypothetical protein